MGATGVGKGSTLNSCFASDEYSTSQTFDSDTIKPVSFMLPWRGSGNVMRGVDLCGFSDSEGRDTGFIDSMVTYLKEEVKSVNVFLLLLNSQEVRVGMHLKDMLVALKNVFGVPFMGNVMIGFTRWDYTRKGSILRRGVTKESLSASVNGLLRQLLGHEHDCECVFLDNTVGMFGPDELLELHGDELPTVSAAFDAALEEVRRAAVGNTPFVCTDIESTLAERDVGRDALERETAAIAHGDESRDAFAAQWEETEIDEPQHLDERLHEGARTARERLKQFLASKTRPDLEHVMAEVLESFDAGVAATIERAKYRNSSAATSANRTLRMALAREYTGFIASQSDDTSKAPRESFDAIFHKYDELLGRFVGACKGGRLAWKPLINLQEHLRMAQVDAREKILRKELQHGHELPQLSRLINEPGALVRLLGEGAAPAWLRMLEQEG